MSEKVSCYFVHGSAKWEFQLTAHIQQMVEYSQNLASYISRSEFMQLLVVWHTKIQKCLYEKSTFFVRTERKFFKNCQHLFQDKGSTVLSICFQRVCLDNGGQHY